MLSAEGCRARRARLWDSLEPRPDWLIVADPQHLLYLGNYLPSPFVFRSVNSAALLVLGADGSSVLVADNMVGSFAEAAHVDRRTLALWYKGRGTAEHRQALLVKSVLDHLRSCPGDQFGYEPSAVPAGIVEGLRAQRPGLKLLDVGPVLHAMKRRKDPDELAILRRSMAAGDAGHCAALEGVRPGMTELDIYRLVSTASEQAAGEQVLVYGDFVSGPRCESKGGPPSGRVVEKGDLVLLDFSVVVHGYRGDFANTFVCGAGPSAEQRRLFEACLEALADGERLVRPGRPCREMDAGVRASFAARGLAENFVSHSGHGLGLGHPDPPYLTPESTDTLVEGDVIAIEPGQYISGVAGMRYERNYLVTASGYETLSKLTLALEQPPRGRDC
jgi:Xaa-Pro aminopeptidase